MLGIQSHVLKGRRLGLLVAVLSIITSLTSCGGKDYSNNEWIKVGEYNLSYDRGVHFKFKKDGSGELFDKRKAPSYYKIEFTVSNDSITIESEGKKWGTGNFGIETGAFGARVRVLYWMGETYLGNWVN